MRYQLTRAKSEQQIIKQCLRSGTPLPSAIENAPELIQGLELYWVAFNELNSCRAFGWQIGPIPLVDVLAYAKHYEFTPDQTERLIRYVQVMDKAYLDYTQSKQEMNSPKPKSTNFRKRR